MRGVSVLLMTLVTAGQALGQGFETVGSRALGMGGAFVAVADDATAAYWNPAGLPTGAFFSLLVDHTLTRTRLDPAQPDAPGADGMGTIVAMSTNAVALSYYRLRVNQIERAILPGASFDPVQRDQWGEATVRSVVTHNVALTSAQMVYEGVSVGSTVRYVYGSYGTGLGNPHSTTGSWLHQAASLTQRGNHKVDLDVGVKLGTQMVQVGLVARNLLQPELKAPDGSAFRLNRQVRAGLAIRPGGRLVVAADVDLSRLHTGYGERRNLAVGAEHWFGEWLGIRGGARVNLEDAAHDHRVVGAFGVSLALTFGVYLDAQLTRGSDQTERGWSIAGRVGF